jgi:hypothetical protein
MRGRREGGVAAAAADMRREGVCMRSGGDGGENRDENDELGGECGMSYEKL